MAMVDDRRSRLNPNAPVFVPNASFSEVEDFSPEWWDLVKTSPWFRDYWLSENQEDDFNSSFEGDDDWSELEFPGMDDRAQFVKSEGKIESAPKKGAEPVNGLNSGMDVKALLKNLNMNVSKSPRERGPKSPVGASKYCEKKLASKRVMNPKCRATPRLHQPR